MRSRDKAKSEPEKVWGAALLVLLGIESSEKPESTSNTPEPPIKATGYAEMQQSQRHPRHSKNRKESGGT